MVQNIFKIVDAGHFWCKPSSRSRAEAEKYYTLIGKINDYCCNAEKQPGNQKSKIPRKGKICLVKRTSDRCWYRAKVLSIFQTINGPQARVLLVDHGERTLVPGIWIQEIPEEFANIPYQTMECVLSGLKPLTMVTSYFDLTIKKQPGDIWDISATDWLKNQINGRNLQVDVKHIDEDGIHHVLLFATDSDSMICFNDELVNNEYAVFLKSSFEAKEKNSSPSKADLQDSFSEELKNMKEKLNNSLSLNGEESSGINQQSLGGGKRNKYQPLTWSEESEESAQGSENELGKQPISAKGWDSRGPINMHYCNDGEKSKVRFMSARLPSTGSNEPPGGFEKQLKPILKNSSGYSSSEDSQKEIHNQRNLRKNVSGFSKETNSLHYQNDYFTPQFSSSRRNDFSEGGLSAHGGGQMKASNSVATYDQGISRNNQNLTTHNEDSWNSQKSMPVHTGVPPSSQHTFDGHKNTGEWQNEQNVSNEGRTSSQQKFHSELQTENSIPVYPAINQVGTGNNQRFQPNVNTASWVSTPQQQNTQNSLPPRQHVGQNLPLRSSSNGASSSLQNAPLHGPDNPPHFTEIPKNLVQSSCFSSSQDSAQSSNLHNCHRPPQNIPPQTSRYVPITTSQSHQQPVSRIQSVNVPHDQLPQGNFVPKTNRNIPEVPNSQPQSTSVPQSTYTLQQQPLYSPFEYSNVSSSQARSTLVSQNRPENYPPRQPQCSSMSTSESQSVPGTHVQFSSAPQSRNQGQSISTTPAQYPPYRTPEYRNVPTCTQSTHHMTQSNPPCMAQSLDILNKTVPSQRFPTGQTLSGFHNNHVLSQASGNYPNLAGGIPENTTNLQPKQVSPKSSQRNNQMQSSSYQPLSTKQQDTSPLTRASNTPRSPAQASSTITSPTKSPRIPSSPMPDAKLCHVIGDVIVHGKVVPKTEFDLKIFPEGVLRGLRDMGVMKPSSFQVNLWSAIIRGRDVFGIPETSSDNVMAYLAPVITLLAEPTTYSKLPLGNGALALILCEGWQKATAVYEQCRKLTKHVRNIRVQIVYGAGAEDECIPSLINGCEVLVATLPCLLRMLRRKCTRLDRLCHIVFDNADILAEEQTECVKELMREFGTLLQAQPDRQAPRQCIAIGNKWTTGIASLVKVYLGNPVVVIGNHVEAAMFCNVQQIINYVSSSKRESELIGLLDKYTMNNEHEIIIFTSTAKDAERLAQMLEYYSFTVLLAHEFLWPEQLVEVRRRWNTPHSSDSFLILVMTDNVIEKCNIKTATLVIHYESAPTKKLFGKRMFCMASSYPSTEERQCSSLTIGTEYSTACARSIKELALRSSGIVPPTLEKVCELAYQGREEKKKNDELCTYLKAFGQCKDSLQCKSRHTVFPDVDFSVLLPKSGIVKVLILAVLDASRYFVRILEHQSDSQEMDSSNYYSGATFLKLALDLNSVYTSRDNRHVCSRIHLQKLCVVESEGSYYRAKIIQIVRKDAETNRALEVQVYFIDRGFYEVIPSYNLFEIAPQFADIPYQAVEAYVCRVKPLDNDRHWTNKAIRYVVQHIEGQELEGRVLMGLRNTIWLDPLVKKEHLKEINVTTNSFNVRLNLLKEGVAVHNGEHVENLKKHFTTFVPLKDITGCENFDGSSDLAQTQTCTLPDQGSVMVKVSSILTPELLYVRLDANSNSLEDLADEINENINRQLTVNHEDFSIASLCLAKFTDNERWYRAKILSIGPEGEYDVFFVDYGDRQWITRDRLAPMRPEYLQLPFQAIECSLVNISPVGTDWSEDDAEGLWNLVEDKVLMEDKLLHAKVKSKSAAMLSGMCRYGIELWDTSTERDILVNHELVVAGHAQATLEYNKTLFPEAFDSNTTGHPKEQFEEIPVLCLQLYKAQDSNAKLRYAHEIKSIVSENMKRKDEIRESGGVRCICRLLGVIKDEAVQEYIVITLAFLATQNDLNCEEIRREGGLKILCDLLSKAKNVKVQEHSVWALKILSTSERNRDATREIGGIKSLCDLLTNTDQEKVQENICWAVVSLCSDNNNNCDAIREGGGLSTLFKLLETSRSNSVLENAMWAISLLAYNASNKTFIGQHGGIEIICNLIKRSQDEKILQNAVRSLKTLSSYNDVNREVMCRLGMIELMRRLSSVQTQLPFDIRRTCLDLIQRLLGRAPDVPLIEASSITSPLQEPIKCKPIAVTKKRKIQENGKMVNGAADSDDDLPLLEDTAKAMPTVHPMTMWSQTKRFVSLSIKLRGVEEKNSNISENKFYFRTIHMEKFYELNLELFAHVIPKESKVHLRGSEVLVSLKKAQPVKWQRLLSTAEKPPFLSVDFDRWNTDSECEEECKLKQPRAPTSSTKKEDKVVPLPFDDDQNDSSELSSDEDPRERIGLDFS